MIKNPAKKTVSRATFACACVAISLASLTASADEIQMNPGMWETTTTMKSNMMGETTKTTKECMTKDTFDPAKITKDMMEGMPAADCESSNDVSGSNVTIKMTCKMPGGSMNAAGNWIFNGDEGSGTMKMDVEMQGMSMNLEMESNGRRVGDC